MDGDMNTDLLSSPKNAEKSLQWRVWVESKKLWIVAGPAIFTRLSLNGLFWISQAFIGRIGNTELAALSIVFQVLVRFSQGILGDLTLMVGTDGMNTHNTQGSNAWMENFSSGAIPPIVASGAGHMMNGMDMAHTDFQMGMSSGLETLCGQAFGAKQYHMLGIYLQRSWIIESIFSVPLILLFIFSGPVLKFLGQTEEIANMANIIALWYIPFMLSLIFYSTLQMYLQTQSKNMIIIYMATLSFDLHVFGCWALDVRLGLGLPGVMVSLIICSWIPIIGQLIYVLYFCPQTWTGFSMYAFADMWPILKLSVSSGVMLCMEIWYAAPLILLIGHLKDATIAVSAISVGLTVCSLSIVTWELTMSFGFLSAASVRVGNELGRGSAKAAKFAVIVVVMTSLGIGIVMAAFILLFRRKISYIFSNSADVAEAVSNLSVLLAFSILFNSVQPVLSGVAVGGGWQGIVVWINFICYYLIGLPLGIVLGYVVGGGVQGVWIGMIVGTAIQTLVLISLTCRIDWNEQVAIAKARVDRWHVLPPTHSDGTAT